MKRERYFIPFILLFFGLLLFGVYARNLIIFCTHKFSVSLSMDFFLLKSLFKFYFYFLIVVSFVVNRLSQWNNYGIIKVFRAFIVAHRSTMLYLKGVSPQCLQNIIQMYDSRISELYLIL